MSEPTIEISDNPLATCDGCGLQTNSPELLTTRRKSFSKRMVRSCFACQVESIKYARRLNWAILAIALLVTIVAYVSKSESSNPEKLYWNAIILLYVFCLSPLAALLHEGGHALAAHLCGWKIKFVILGLGKDIWRGRIRDCLLIVRHIQMGGMICSYPNQFTRWFSLQAFCFVLGGPLASLAAALIIIPFGVSFLKDYYSYTASFLVAWAFLNITGFLLSLVPCKIILQGVPTGSDGLQLCWIIFTPKSFRLRFEYSKPFVEFSTLRLLGELDRALTTIRDFNSKNPDDLMGISYLSAAFSDCANYQEALETSRYGLQLLADGAALNPAFSSAASPGTIRYLEAAFKNNLAYSILKLKSSDKNEGIELARQAYEICPWLPAVQATYGYSLGLSGKPAEGIELMKKAIPKLSNEPKLAVQTVRENIQEVSQLL